MARIKAVMNERRLAYEGAVELIEDAKDKEENLKVQQYLEVEQKKERKYLERRRAYEARKLEQQKLSIQENPLQTPSESPTAPIELHVEQQTAPP